MGTLELILVPELMGGGSGSTATPPGAADWNELSCVHSSQITLIASKLWSLCNQDVNKRFQFPGNVV